MKRLALLLAAVAVILLFTACDKDKERYYTEQVEWSSNGTTDGSTIYRHFVQEFTIKNNEMIYNPCSEINRQNGYIDFNKYCDKGTTPIICINGDSLVYDVEFSVPFMNFMPKPHALVKKNRDGFSFSYSFDLDYTLEIKHECHRIKSLSN